MTQKIQALELSLSNQSNEQKNCALHPNGTLKNVSYGEVPVGRGSAL